MVKPTTRWRFNDPALLWIFLVTYVAHIVEEAVVTAPILLWHVRIDRPLSMASFLTAQVLGLVLMAAGVSLAPTNARFYWVVPRLRWPLS
jgi:hypothetical protein